MEFKKLIILGTAILMSYACPKPEIKENTLFNSKIHTSKEEVTRNGRYVVEADVNWTYHGKDPIEGPVNYLYSLCFGPPAIDDAAGQCVAGKHGEKTLDRLIDGTSITEKIKFSSFGSKISTSKGLKSFEGYRPHIAIQINTDEEDLYEEDHLLKPISKTAEK